MKRALRRLLTQRQRFAYSYLPRLIVCEADFFDALDDSEFTHGVRRATWELDDVSRRSVGVVIETNLYCRERGLL
jgi:hypothetical protein